MLAIFTATLLSGCGGKSSGSMVPLSGKVFVGSEQIMSGNVTLIPTESGSANRALSAGQIKNGVYTIYTDGKEGAPPGKYKITVTPEMKPSADGKKPEPPWDPKYSDQKETTLTVDLVEGQPQKEHNLSLSKSN
jgi:hypothetical protein